MADPARAPRPIDPPAPPPTLRNLFGLIPDWLAGDPETQTRLDAEAAAQDAEVEAMRQRLYERIGAAIPEPVKRAARGAKDYVTREYLTPPPYVEDLRQRLTGALAPPAVPAEGAAPIERGLVEAANTLTRRLPEAAIDYGAGSMTPAEMAMNALPQVKAAAGAAQLAGVPFALPRRYGSLAATVKRTPVVGEYALRDPVVRRLQELYAYGRSLPTTSNWSGANAERLLRAFRDDPLAAERWARLWGATSANTSVPVNTRESVSALAHHLMNPGTELTRTSARQLPGAAITMAGSKVPNINRAYLGEPLGGDKVEAMAQFMLGNPRVPLDVHALYALGAYDDKLANELPGLRRFFAESEGLPLRGSFTPTDLYTRYEDAVANALRDIAPRRQINPVFADLWEGTRAYKGLQPQGGPIDILGAQGLLVPGGMTDPERMLDALGRKRWTINLAR